MESAQFLEDWGIRGDAHAGKWHRQVSLLSYEKIVAFRAKGAQLEFGPGSPKAARQGLECILPSLKHGLEILKGTTGDCAR